MSILSNLLSLIYKSMRMYVLYIYLPIYVGEGGWRGGGGGVEQSRTNRLVSAWCETGGGGGRGLVGCEDVIEQ